MPLPTRVSALGTLAGLVGAAMIAGTALADGVTPDRLVNSEREPGNWLNHHGNYEAHRFSGLREINKVSVQTNASKSDICNTRSDDIQWHELRCYRQHCLVMITVIIMLFSI